MASLTEAEANALLAQYSERISRRFGTHPPDYPQQTETADQSPAPARSRVFYVNDTIVRPYYGSPRQEIRNGRR